MDNLLAGKTDPPCFKQDQLALSVVQRRCRADEWPLIKPFRHLNIHSDRDRNPIHFPPERLFTSAQNRYSHSRSLYSLRSESAASADQDVGKVFPSIGYAQPPYVIAKRLFALDEMDFDVFSLSHIARLAESHTQDVLVMWPDGRLETGLEPHMATMIELFTFSPDLIIQEHPIRFGAGEWTALVGVMHGSFSGMMRNPAGGKPIMPTGKKFKMTMATFSHWRGGLMDAEYLVWDNAALMRQMGVL